ncbi:conserved hypothetical protein [uncultured spirochete]|uniref:Uncharacterized protein n=1 Tax=uncultured spirochete TaxID=156406 RepID=A0A3P3XPI0_9SPIR|nr:conserved hypothetical protein [uncultured spirochete]
MQIRLSSGMMHETIEVSEKHIAGILCPNTSSAFAPLDDNMIRNAINHPVNSLNIENRTTSSSKVAIVVDDATRPTPTSRILSIILKKLSGIGIPDQNISITIATGLHRNTTAHERTLILGDDVISRFDIADNDARNPIAFAHAGTITGGKEIYLNKRILEADIVITIGVVKSHAFAGFTGGAKSILPGVASQNTIHGNHCFYNIEYPRGVLGSCEMSATRKEMEATARLVNPFIVNVVLGDSNQIIYAVSGDVVDAHRSAVDFYKKIALRTFPEKVDIAVVHGGLAGSINFYQALFGCNVVKTTERPILKKNGIVILFAECKEGSGSKLLEQIMPTFSEPDEILKYLASNKVFDDQWAVQFLATFLRDIHIFLVSEGVSSEIAKNLKVKLFPNAKEALDAAIQTSDLDYRMAFIENPDVLIVNLA